MLVYPEFFSATRKFTGRIYGKKIEEVCGEEVLRRIEGGREISRAEYKGKYYQKALQIRAMIAQSFVKAFAKTDVIALPTTPTLPRERNKKTEDPRIEYASDICTTPASIAGICGASVPIGKIQKIPVGLQLLAPSLKETLLCSTMQKNRRDVTIFINKTWFLKKMMRTHTCGELTKKEIEKKVIICGWIHARRDHGGIIFLDIRDTYGRTQIVCDPQHNKQVHRIAERLGRETVVQAKGTVQARPSNMENKELKSGEIEVIVDALIVLNEAETPPIDIDTDKDASEEVRLRYRYLDLRREKMQKTMKKRHKAAQIIRTYFTKNNFLEIETPLLIRSTPEGARDYVVPSRIHPGKFYALPQSPQIYKQLLMVAGVDRYFQLARCLRDEDLRQDRQPEHTQIDFEMSFVDEEDIRKLIEGLYVELTKELTGKTIEKAFPVLSYEECMERFGSDKPDIRFGMELCDVTDIVKKSSFQVFTQAEQVKCIVLKQDISRKEVDEYIEWSKQEKAKGLAWLRVKENKLESSIAKFFSDEIQQELMSYTKAEEGATLFFVADKPKIVASVLGKLRLVFREKYNLVEKETYAFCWVTKFPLFEWNDEEERWEAMHHIFSRPIEEDKALLSKHPEKVRGALFDIVLNGIELGSGSLRVTEKKIQEQLLKIIGLDQTEAEKRFGFMTEAFRYGVPPHGGMGLGFDRSVALLCGYNDIREVIAFPKNKKAENPMDNCPTAIDQQQLKELHIDTLAKKEQDN